MNRRRRRLVAWAAAGLPFAPLAQPRERVWRVAYFSSAAPGLDSSEQAFLAGMKELGYELGRNLIVDSRYAEGDASRYPALADELIALRPDVVLVTSTGNAITMKSKTTTIPIVLGSPGDPVADGLVHSLARPGGNITGNSLQLSELSAKQIEMLAETLPRMRRLALLVDSSQVAVNNDRVERLAAQAAAAKRITLVAHHVASPDEIRLMLRTSGARKTDALLLTPTPRFNVLRREGSSRDPPAGHRLLRRVGGRGCLDELRPELGRGLPPRGVFRGPDLQGRQAG